MTLPGAIRPLSFSEARTQEKQECYLCGVSLPTLPQEHRTRDHLPPRNLFPEPRPFDLITAPCCRTCNNAADKDDDYLRLAVCGYYNTTDKGKQIWKEKAVGSTVRKGRLRTQVAAMNASLKQIALITPEGVRDAFEIEIDAAAVNRVLTRMTKGFLSLLYPGVNRADLTFRVSQLDQFKVNSEEFAQIAPLLNNFERGDGVYRCWHGVEEYSFTGLWVHMFFGSAWYQVEHVSDRKIILPWAGATDPS